MPLPVTPSPRKSSFLAKISHSIAFSVVLDRSGSMSGDPLAAALRAAKTVVQNLRREDNFSLIPFDDAAEGVIPMGPVSSKQVVIDRIDRIQTGGSTNLTAGSTLGRDELRSTPAGTDRRPLLLTDGLLNLNPSPPENPVSWQLIIYISTRAKISLLLLLMKSPALTLAFSILLASSLTSLGAEPKLKPLFNGKDLTHFKAEGASEFWSVEKGVLIGQNNAAQKGHYLLTEKEYGDFVIEFDVRWKGTTERGVDTGLEMRKPHLQLQLGISGSLRVDMSGSFYTGGKPAYPEAGQAKDAKKLMKPEGEWNTFRIQAKGNTFTCWINGVKASEYTDAKFAGAAPLGLQIHGSVVMKCEYRNMKIAEL